MYFVLIFLQLMMKLHHVIFSAIRIIHITQRQIPDHCIAGPLIFITTKIFTAAIQETLGTVVATEVINRDSIAPVAILESGMTSVEWAHVVEYACYCFIVLR